MGNLPNKATGGGAGAAGGIGVGGAIAALVIAVWFPHADASVAVNLGTVISAVLGTAGAFVGAYLPPHNG